MRLTGFQSGLDLNQMVSDLMKAQRMPMNKLTQQKQLLEWKRDDYRETNRLLTEFSNLSFDMTLQRTYSQKQVTSSNNKVSAIASSSAANATYTISDVKVATPASRTSTGILDGGSKFDPSKSIFEQKDMFTDEAKSNIMPGSFSFQITTYNQQGDPVPEVFTFEETASMNEVINKINSSKLGVTAFFDEVKGNFTIAKKDAGVFKPDTATAEIEFSGAFLTDVLQLEKRDEVGGEEASLKINGLVTTRNSNTFTINGVTITLNGDMAETATISIKNDTEKTFNAVKDYITKYNELLEKINGKLGEAVYRDYKPLSSDEREALSEKQIEQWEEKARSGLLRNDSILSSGLGKMRNSLYESVSGIGGSYNQLSQIGITTGANYREKGKLLIDEDKLREAIEKDPNAVMQLFTANGETASSKGIARKLREEAQSTIRAIEARAGNSSRTAQQFTIGRELLNVDQRISAFERRMQTVEARYWRQFTAMEKAIGQSNQQSMQLMSQFYNNG